MERKERDALIDTYRNSYQAVVGALDGITETELDARPAPDHWTAREVVHHLADAEMRSAIRLRTLLVEDEPVIQGYDEAAFARRLHYGERPIEASLLALRGSRETSAQLLDLLSEDDWARKGTHTESGPFGVEDWLRVYAAHPLEHADQIRQCRQAASREAV